MKKILIFLLISAFFISIKPYLNKRFPYTHDGENHLARFANYKVAVKEGQIPPRFAPNLLNHYGYPVFNYNYPLANILSLPFSFLKINYEISFKLISVGFIIIGLLGINSWLRQLTISPESRLVAQILFLTNPYLLNLVYFRGNIGEIMALGLLPNLLALIETLSTDKSKNLFNFKFILILTAFFLAHNITVLFGLGILLIYASFKYRKNLLYWLKMIVNLSLALALSLWFWLPAIIEKSAINLDLVNLNTDFMQHFPSFHQLFFSTYQFGFSYLSSVDSLSFNLGFTQSLTLLITIILLYKLKKQNSYQSLLPYLKLGVWFNLMLIIFQLKFTQSVWQLIPFAAYIQFPWRLTLFFAILILPLAAIVFTLTQKKTQYLILIALTIQLLSTIKLQAVDYFHKTNADYDAFPQSTSTLNENIAKNFTYQDIGNWQIGPKILIGKGQSKIINWQGSRRSYELKLEETATIIEPTMQYLGWQSQANGQKIDYIDSPEIAGRIAYQLAAGEYTVNSQFTQNTWPRLVGNSISLITGIWLIIYQIKKGKYFKVRQ